MRSTILVADDDPNDQFFIQRELAKVDTSITVKFVNDGEQAVAYLEKAVGLSDRTNFPAPTVIFIDLKMPRMNGFEVLAWLKAHPELKQIPTVVVSSSDAQRDIDEAYKLGANAYLVKPANVDDFRKLFRTTGEFFLEHAATPTVSKAA
jgi:CheY-like chemotaxis protein